MYFTFIFLFFLPLFSEEIYLNKEPLQPILKETTLNKNKIELGEKLFNDKFFSKNNTISCATCHNLSLGELIILENLLELMVKQDG